MALIHVPQEMMLLRLGITAWVTSISSSMITNDVSGDALIASDRPVPCGEAWIFDVDDIAQFEINV